jgi:presenilin-like A22 family membrane protease
MAEHLLGQEPVIEHPNRDKASSKTTRVVVVVLLLISAALVFIITFGGWEVIQGLTLICLAWGVLYVVLAYYVSRWNRGVLPVIAALAIIMAIFCMIAVPQWFDRDAFGFEQPALDANIVGTLTAILIPVQLLLLFFAMQGFVQAWNVEFERWEHDEEPVVSGGPPSAPPAGGPPSAPPAGA